jgi:AraC-like DNA-binding protein
VIWEESPIRGGLCLDGLHSTLTALRDLITLHLGHASSAPIFVTMPKEPRAARVAQAIFDTPGHAKPLAGLCSDAGVSIRTVQRIFAREVGTDPDSWRRQVRLTRAVNLLVSGCSVKEVSFAVGYNQSSAFVAAFRRLFGSTPKAWVVALGALPRRAAERKLSVSASPNGS